MLNFYGGKNKKKFKESTLPVRKESADKFECTRKHSWDEDDCHLAYCAV